MRRSFALALVVALALGGCIAPDAAVVDAATPARNPPTLTARALAGCLARRTPPGFRVVETRYSEAVTLRLAVLLNRPDPTRPSAGRVRAYVVVLTPRGGAPGGLGLRRVACVVDAGDGGRFLSAFPVDVNEEAEPGPFERAALRAAERMARRDRR